MSGVCANHKVYVNIITGLIIFIIGWLGYTYCFAYSQGKELQDSDKKILDKITEDKIQSIKSQNEIVEAINATKMEILQRLSVVETKVNDIKYGFKP